MKNDSGLEIYEKLKGLGRDSVREFLAKLNAHDRRPFILDAILETKKIVEKGKNSCFRVSETRRSLIDDECEEFDYDRYLRERRRTEIFDMNAREVVEYLNSLTAEEEASLVFYLISETKKALKDY